MLCNDHITNPRQLIESVLNPPAPMPVQRKSDARRKIEMLKPFAAFAESFRALSLELLTLSGQTEQNRQPATATDSLPAVSRSFPPFLSLTSLPLFCPLPYSPIFPSPLVPFPEQGTVRSTSQFYMVINITT